jgi:PAS domain S-box-containing protein
MFFFGAYMLYFILANLGRWQPAEFNLISAFNISGSMLALILLIRFFEISRQEASDALLQTNSLLRDNQNELRLILDSAAEGIYGIDLNGKCTFCNARSLEILGYKNYIDLIGKDMHILVHRNQKDGSELPASECKILKAVLSGEKVHCEDEVFWRSDGTSFMLNTLRTRNIKKMK